MPPPCWCCQGVVVCNQLVLPRQTECSGDLLRAGSLSSVPPPSPGVAASLSQEGSHQSEMGAGAGTCLQRGGPVPSGSLWPAPRRSVWQMLAGPCWWWGSLRGAGVVAAGVAAVVAPAMAPWRGDEAGLAALAPPRRSAGLTALCHDFPLVSEQRSLTARVTRVENDA